jgi:hypothetical protein
MRKGPSIAFAIAAILLIALVIGVWSGDEEGRQYEGPADRSEQPVPGNAPPPRTEPAEPASRN